MFFFYDRNVGDTLDLRRDIVYGQKGTNEGAVQEKKEGDMGKSALILFGAGMIGRKTYQRYKDVYDITAVIDNDPGKQGMNFEDGIKIISFNEFLQKYKDISVMVSVVDRGGIEKQLTVEGISYVVSPVIYRDENVATDMDIHHDNWAGTLKALCDKEGMDVLEIGSRVVTGNCFRNLFEKASYVGFDYYMGENVDVVGDAHRLSSYFDKKFDLIFSSAVFEHLAMPWQAALEIVKLLKPGGYIFIETHYSFSSHERPWHFFQFSENALDVLFPAKFGMECIKKGCANLLEGRFSAESSKYLQGRMVEGLYCHSEYLGKKVADICDSELRWDRVALEDVVGSTKYPASVQKPVSVEKECNGYEQAVHLSDI